MESRECPSIKECVVLQQYINEKIKHIEQVIGLKDHISAVKIENIEKGLVQAEKVLDARLSKENEVRKQLTEQNQEFSKKFESMLPRNEYIIQHENLNGKVNELETFRAVVNAKASQLSMYIALGIALAGFIIAFIDLIVGLRK